MFGDNMTMDVFPDSPILGMSTSSPRISFSHVGVAVPVEEHYIRSPTSSDFDFCVFRQALDLYEPSSADDLFLDGKILPIQITRRLPPILQSTPDQIEVLPVPPPETERLVVQTPNKTNGGGGGGRSSEERPKSSSSWLFRRSSSLNCGGGHSGSSGLCPLPLLSRSLSTGSGKQQQRPSAKQHNRSINSILKHHNKDRGKNVGTTAAAAACYSNSNAHSSNSKPPWKPKSMSNPSNYYGVKFQPVLNVLPPSNLFGLGSIFSSRTSKRN